MTGREPNSETALPSFSSAWAPSVLIRLPLEGPPRIELETQHESDRVRIVDWLAACPELHALVQRAHELAEEAKAA